MASSGPARISVYDISMVPKWPTHDVSDRKVHRSRSSPVGKSSLTSFLLLHLECGVELGGSSGCDSDRNFVMLFVTWTMVTRLRSLFPLNNSDPLRSDVIERQFSVERAKSGWKAVFRHVQVALDYEQLADEVKGDV